MPRLVVIDDRVATRSAVYRRLATFHALQFAETVRDGRTILRRVSADLVLLDAGLALRLGLSVLADLRSGNATIPVILLAQRGSEALCAAAFRAGARDYFSDPIAAGPLARSIDRILGHESSRREVDTRPALVASMPARRNAIDPRILSALQYVRDHCHEHLTLGAVARTVGLGKFTLSHRFTELADVSFRTYLARIRVEKAKELLENPDHSMPIIAERAGFRDISRFNKVFRKYAELTPSAYRRGVTARNAQKKARTA